MNCNALLRVGSIAMLLTGPALQAQTPCFFPGDAQRWDHQFAAPGITTGTVHAMQPSVDGTLLIATSATSRFGGDLYNGSVARWDGERYTPLGGGLYGVSGNLTVYAMVEDAAGNVYLGGSFSGATNPNGTPVNSKNLIKWNQANQQWEALGLGVNGQVWALALDQDTLYLGGSFSQTEGPTPVQMSKVGRFLLGSGTYEGMGTGVGSSSAGLNGQVNVIAIGASHEVFVGGAINQAGGLVVNSIARWTPGSGWDDMNGGLPSFAINGSGVPTGVSSAATVQSLAFNPLTGKLYAGGTFGEYIGSAGVAQTKGLAEWDGTNWTLLDGIGIPFNSSAFSVHALMVDPAANKLYAGGTFFQYVATNPANSAKGNGIMALDLANLTWDNLGGGILPSANNGGTVRAIAKWQGQIFAGGNFARMQPAGDFANNIAAYNGSSWDNLGNGLNGAGSVAYEVISLNGDIVISGSFSKVDNQEFPGVAMWDPSTGWDTLVSGFFGNGNSNFQSIVTDMYLDGFNLYLGGQFGGAGNITSTGLLRYNTVVGTWTSWGTGLGGFSTPRVHDFAKFQGSMYVAGYFTTIDGVPATYIARLTPGGWASVGTFNGRVYDLEQSGDSVMYAVGDFTQVNGNTQIARVARFDGTTWTPLGQGVTAGQVFTVAIHPQTGIPFFGGNLSTVKQTNGNNLSVKALAKFENGTWSSVGNFTNEATFSRINHMLFGPDGTLYMTGGFTRAGGETVNHVLRWNASYGIAGLGNGLNAFAPVSSVPGEKLALIDSFLYVVGGMYKAGNNQSVGIARYHLDNPAAAALVVDLGPDATSCTPVQLDAGVPGVNYLWSTGEQTQTIFATSTGWYSVLAFQGSCSDEDSIFITIFTTSPVFAADTISGCDEVVIDAGPGFASYFWNTGDTTQSVTINDNDLIMVTVVDANECVTKDSIFAEIIGYSPTASFSELAVGDSVVTFDATLSFNATGYLWDFGDGNTGTGMTTQHKYTSNDTFMVTLVVTNECGNDTLVKFVVVDYLTNLEREALLAAVQVSPNPTNGMLNVEGRFDSRMLELVLRDLTGRELDHLRKNNVTGAWRESLDLSALPSGIYLLEIRTDKTSVLTRVVKQ